jgi:hypothetical protein
MVAEDGKRRNGMNIACSVCVTLPERATVLAMEHAVQLVFRVRREDVDVGHVAGATTGTDFRREGLGYRDDQQSSLLLRDGKKAAQAFSVAMRLASPCHTTE